MLGYLGDIRARIESEKQAARLTGRQKLIFRHFAPASPLMRERLEEREREVEF